MPKNSKAQPHQITLDRGAKRESIESLRAEAVRHNPGLASEISKMGEPELLALLPRVKDSAIEAMLGESRDVDKFRKR